MSNFLPPRIRSLLNNAEMKGLCSLSLLETILHRLGRLKFEGGLEHFFTAGLSEDLQLLELTPAIAGRTNELPEDLPPLG